MYKLSLKAALLAISLTVTCASVKATGIFSNTAGTLSSGAGYFGQFFTTPAVGGPWSDITFNYYSNSGPATTPYANGDLFLLSAAYNGLPTGLNTSTPGFIAEALSSSIVNGVWVFNGGVTLQTGTVYYVYGDALLPNAAITGGNSVAGAGDSYTSSAGVPFDGPNSVSSNFAVNSIPEPGTGLTMLIGALTLAGVTVRRWRSAR